MTDPTTPSTTGPMRVLLVDGDDCIRESLEGLLRIGDRLVVVGSAGDAQAALAIAAREAPDVVVLDPRLPGADGEPRSLITRLRAVAPGVRVLALRWAGAADDATDGTGADASIRKTFRPHELIDAVVTTGRRTDA